MRVVILGATGMLGSMLVWNAKQKKIPFSIVPRSVDALTVDYHQLCPFFQKGDYVINCIGAIPQRNYMVSEMIQLNMNFSYSVAKACAETGSFMVHISTNCVFAHPNARIDDIKDATDNYGKTKGLGEPPDASCIIRSSIIGLERSSSNGLLEWYLHNNTPVNGYIDTQWNGITTLALSDYLLNNIVNGTLLNKKIHHVVSPTTISKYTLLKLVRDIWGKGVDIYPYTSGKTSHSTLYGTDVLLPIESQLVALKFIELEFKAEREHCLN
jgi:dTDP-4-dehydrorhamnose reductase